VQQFRFVCFVPRGAKMLQGCNKFTLAQVALLGTLNAVVASDGTWAQAEIEGCHTVVLGALFNLANGCAWDKPAKRWFNVVFDSNFWLRHGAGYVGSSVDDILSALLKMHFLDSSTQVHQHLSSSSVRNARSGMTLNDASACIPEASDASGCHPSKQHLEDLLALLGR